MQILDQMVTASPQWMVSVSSHGLFWSISKSWLPRRPSINVPNRKLQQARLQKNFQTGQNLRVVNIYILYLESSVLGMSHYDLDEKKKKWFNFLKITSSKAAAKLYPYGKRNATESATHAQTLFVRLAKLTNSLLPRSIRASIGRFWMLNFCKQKKSTCHRAFQFLLAE